MQHTLLTSLSTHKNPMWEVFLEKVSVLPKMKLVTGPAGIETWPLTPKPTSSHRLHCLICLLNHIFWVPLPWIEQDGSNLPSKIQAREEITKETGIFWRHSLPCQSLWPSHHLHLSFNSDFKLHKAQQAALQWESSKSETSYEHGLE